MQGKCRDHDWRLLRQPVSRGRRPDLTANSDLVVGYPCSSAGRAVTTVPGSGKRVLTRFHKRAIKHQRITGIFIHPGGRAQRGVGESHFYLTIFCFSFNHIQKITPIPAPLILHTQIRMSITNHSPTDRAAINRENARRSTGPRTPAGKDISRLNAMRHTFCGQTVVSSKNNLVAYGRFRKRFLDDLQPKGIIEVQLVQTLADCGRRLNCARAYETNLLTLGAEEQAASIKVEDPEIHSALATAKSYRAQSGALASISMHEQRVSREFHRTLKELRELQAARCEHERCQKIEAARLYKLHNELQQAAQCAAPGATNEPRSPYDATEDGFVLANDEIETYIRREDRRTAARKAEFRRSAPAA
jgi:hypothetical protein